MFVLNEGGLVFVKPMREKHFVTMLDPFHVKYGKALAAVMSLVSVVTDLAWFPSTLIGLGKFHSISVCDLRLCPQDGAEYELVRNV